MIVLFGARWTKKHFSEIPVDAKMNCEAGAVGYFCFARAVILERHENLPGQQSIV